MKRDATSETTRKGHGRTSADPGCRMSRRLQRSDASRDDCGGLSQVASHDLAMDQASEGQSAPAQSDDLGERLRRVLSPSQADRSRDGGPMHRVLEDRATGASATPTGRSCRWREDDGASTQGDSGLYPAFEAAEDCAEAIFGIVAVIGLGVFAVFCLAWGFGL